MEAKEPGAAEARQRKVEQRQRERAVAASPVENERPQPASTREAENKGKGEKRRAASMADSGKENTHGHYTRAKAQRTQGKEDESRMGVRRALQPVLNRSS